MKTFRGKDVDLSKYEGKVLLIVNVASKCGLTPQYEQLEELHEKYAEKGLAVIRFPCNQFGKQEPGTAEEIEEFCKANYHVQFDLYEKIDVNGENTAPIYKVLKAQAGARQKDGEGDIEWNFPRSFSSAATGKVVARFHPKVSPDGQDVVKAIESELAKPARL
ncbi:MAG: glutathione peroxidase [Planctomycetaceae bacterium]